MDKPIIKSKSEKSKKLFNRITKGASVLLIGSLIATTAATALIKSAEDIDSTQVDTQTSYQIENLEDGTTHGKGSYDFNSKESPFKANMDSDILVIEKNDVGYEFYGAVETYGTGKFCVVNNQHGEEILELINPTTKIKLTQEETTLNLSCYKNDDTLVYSKSFKVSIDGVDHQSKVSIESVSDKVSIEPVSDKVSIEPNPSSMLTKILKNREAALNHTGPKI